MGKARSYTNGNALWKLYKGLGEPTLSEFKEYLQWNNVEFMTFIKDTLKKTQLSNIKHSRMRVYQAFFKDFKWEELMPEIKKTAPMIEEEKLDSYAQKLGLSKKAS